MNTKWIVIRESYSSYSSGPRWFIVETKEKALDLLKEYAGSVCFEITGKKLELKYEPKTEETYV